MRDATHEMNCLRARASGYGESTKLLVTEQSFDNLRYKVARTRGGLVAISLKYQDYTLIERSYQHLEDVVADRRVNVFSEFVLTRFMYLFELIKKDTSGAKEIYIHF